VSEPRWERIKAVFNAAMGAAGAERDAVLDRECVGDPDLRREIEGLLDARTAGAVQTAGAVRALQEAQTTTAPRITEGPGTIIGPYKLLQVLGEGGFGVVFMAEQEHPLRRRVALKIIKLGMDTRQVVARFEQERQALALMEHPNIARVFDAGATDSGRPYFVMEYVKGDPITKFADAHRLSIRQRLELFEQVCAAIQHAHTKGVIHRDLKPGNVLVSVADDRPVAKVIDFGIAKATAARLTEKTLFTEHHQLIGTPEYMSPEQAGGSVDIDTRTDVYSLGVLLYELLTGATPFNAARLRSAAFAEMQRIINEEEPPAPSMRLSCDQAALAATAAVRQSEPAKLGALVKGELDWIVMKALDKDRARRYETPSRLAVDVHRHLAGEAIEAAPPSAGYRARKWLRRHRAVVTVAATITMVFILGLVGTGVGLIRANTIRREQLALFEGTCRIERQLIESNMFRLSADWSAMEPVFREGLDIRRRFMRSDHMEVAVWCYYVARSGSDAAEAERLWQECVDIHRRLDAAPTKYLREALEQLAWRAADRGDARESEHRYRDAISVAGQMDSGGFYHLGSMYGLAFRLESWGRCNEATTMYREALEMALARGNEQSITEAYYRLTSNLLDCGSSDDAEAAFLECIRYQRERSDPNSSELATALTRYADVLIRRERFPESEALLREALAIRTEIYPSGDHYSWRRCDTMGALGVAMAGRLCLTPGAELDEVTWNEAESLVLASHAGLENDGNLDAWSRGEPEHPLRTAIGRIVWVYERRAAAQPGTGYEEKASAWRGKIQAGELSE
jgi:serine/threonine protein kinase/tetratricopeptide (TPR) repeat protein